MSFTLYYQNVRGLRTKSKPFFDNVVLNNYDVYCITETWLPHHIVSTDYFTDEYTVFRNDRNYAATGQKYGGGVLIALKKPFRAVRRSDLELYSECLWIEVKVKGAKNVLIGVYYLHPALENSLFASALQGLTEVLKPESYNILLFGDFNCPGSWWDPAQNTSGESKAAHLFNFFSFNNIQPAVLHPNPAGNVLDTVFTNLNSVVVDQFPEPIVAVDAWHPPFGASAHICMAHDNSVSTPRHDFARGDYTSLYHSLDNADWTSVYNAPCVDVAVQELTKTVQNFMDQHIPKRRIRSSKFPFWFSHELRGALRRKRKFHRLFKAHNDPSALASFREWRSSVKKLLARDKKMFTDYTETSLTHSPREFWRYVKFRTRHARESITLQDGDKIVSDPEGVCELFARHFSSTYSTSYDSGSELDFDSHGPVLPIPNVTENDVVSAIRKLPSKKSAGCDSIPCFIVKGCCTVFAPLLCHIIRMSLVEQHFPTDWKIGSIFPLHKSGRATIPANYRPISLLSSFSKVFEKVLHRYLLSAMHPLIHFNQHGFMPGRSVDSNLACFLNDIGPPVLSRQQVDTVYFDCSKAFDIVNHDLLLRKLSAYGLSLEFCQWFGSYLKGRSNCVSYEGATSRPFPMISGVPQGSTLGPLLFNIFVNDIHPAIKHCSLSQYADDMKLYRTISSPYDRVLLQNDINAVSAWCDCNYLKLNLSKTIVISYTRKSSPLTFTYLLLGEPVKRATVVRDLGVMMDVKLLFNAHVNYLTNSCLRTLGVISRATRDFTDRSCFVSLYRALILPKLDFASAIWNCLSPSSSLRLERIQKRFTRTVFSRHSPMSRYEHGGLLKILNLDELSARRSRRDLAFLFNCIHSKFDCPCLVSSVHLRVPSRPLRPHGCFDVDRSMSLAPASRCQLTYNSLFLSPIDVFCSDLVLFKRSLKCMIF